MQWGTMCPHSRRASRPSPTFSSFSFPPLSPPRVARSRRTASYKRQNVKENTHVHVLSPPASFLGWHAILRPLQKKHARNGSFFGCFFPRRPRRGGEWLPSSSSPRSSDSAPLAPVVPPPSRPSRCPRGSVSGYVINVRVCRKGLRGVGVGVRVRVDAGEGDCAHPRSTDESLR
jgi:hypothetical protein